jgi:phosphatidylinositol 3-kinase
MDNPADVKAQKLARGLTRGVIDKDLKPGTEERKRIATILREPPNRPLTIEQKGLLWRFRFSLMSNRSALTRFLKSVDWGDATEAKQASKVVL